MFSQYGELESFRVMRDEHGISRGFGFVCFKKPEDVAKAIAEMNGKTLSGKPLIVTLAQRREQRRQELEQLFMQRQQQMQQTGGRHQGFNSGYRTQQYQIKPRFMGGQQRFQKVQQGQQQTQTSGQFQKDGGRKQGIPQQGQQAIKSQQQKPHQGQQQTTTAGTGEVKFQQNVRNQQTQQKSSKKQQGDQQPQQQIQQQQAGQQKPNAGQQQQTGTSRPGLDATHLASLNPLAQKQILGENLYPLVQEMQPALAGKITGMLLEMDNSDILILLESPEALISKVTEAVTVLKAHNIQ
jgi:polyadenylate-binding protein